MIQIINISNHKLSQNQIKLLKEKLFNVENETFEIINLPENLQKEFSNLPDNITKRKEIVEKIKNFVYSIYNKKDNETFLIIHLDGEAHIVYMIVNTLKKIMPEIGVFKFYSERKVEEKEENGQVIKKSVFIPKNILFYNS